MAAKKAARKQTPFTYAVLREEADYLLRQLTPGQLEKFHQINDSAPWGGWAHCPNSQLKSMVDLIRRTIIHNQKETTVTESTAIPDTYGDW